MTITGANFTGATIVAFGGTSALSFAVTNPGTISATVWIGATGSVTVTTSAGTATSSGTFSYFPMPSISSFTPTSGGGGKVVTITGANFTGATAVTIGGTPAASFSVVSATSITATVGGGATGTIAVTTPGGTATSSGSFTFIPGPAITAFTPSLGGTGTVVTISGRNFTGAGTVAFGGTPAASFTVVSATSISATVGSGATGPITVTTSVGTAVSTSTFTYTILLTGVTLSATPPSPVTVGTPVNLLAAAIGGTNVQYQFWIYNAAASPAWSQLQGYSALASYSWTPTAAGSYLFSITAQDITGTAANTMLWYTVNSIPPLTAVSVTAAPVSPQLVNTPITFTASATGGTQVQYQFWLYTQAANSVEPTAALLRAVHVCVDPVGRGPIPALRHRAGRHRRGGQYPALVYRQQHSRADGGVRHGGARRAATGEYPHYFHRRRDGRRQCAIPVLAV